MIIRNNQTLIDHFRANPSYGYLCFDKAPQGLTLTVKYDWNIITPRATDADVHTMLWSVSSHAYAPQAVDPITRTTEIMRASNDIARVTRRGAGNMLICNSKTKSTFDLSKLPIFTIVIDETIPNEKLFVLYQGKGGFFAAVDGPFSFDGSIFKVRLDWSDFIQCIHFT